MARTTITLPNLNEENTNLKKFITAVENPINLAAQFSKAFETLKNITEGKILEINDTPFADKPFQKYSILKTHVFGENGVASLIPKITQSQNKRDLANALLNGVNHKLVSYSASVPFLKILDTLAEKILTANEAPNSNLKLMPETVEAMQVMRGAYDYIHTTYYQKGNMYGKEDTHIAATGNYNTVQNELAGFYKKLEENNISYNDNKKPDVIFTQAKEIKKYDLVKAATKQFTSLFDKPQELAIQLQKALNILGKCTVNSTEYNDIFRQNGLGKLPEIISKISTNDVTKDNITEKVCNALNSNEVSLNKESAFPPYLLLLADFSAKIIGASKEENSKINLTSEQIKSLETLYGAAIKASGDYGFAVKGFERTGIYEDKFEQKTGIKPTAADFIVKENGALSLNPETYNTNSRHINSKNMFKTFQAKLDEVTNNISKGFVKTNFNNFICM
jgi:hypothetical protein